MTGISVPRVLVPLEIEDAMLISSGVTEPDPSETAWVSAGTYVAGDLRIRTETHRVYMALIDHTGITTLPEDDPTRWKDIGATLQWAMFDGYRDTQTLSTTSLTVVLEPGFFNAVAIYQATGASITVTVKDESGGSTIATHTQSLVGPFVDEYDYCWGPYRQNAKVLMTDILPYPEAELTITVTASMGVEVGIGMVAIGDLRDLFGGSFGGTRYGARAEPVDYSLITTDEFGYTVVRRRGSATDMRLSIVLPQDQADYALGCLQDLLGIPCAVIATTATGYEGLNVFGLPAGPVSYDGPDHATIEMSVKGII